MSPAALVPLQLTQLSHDVLLLLVLPHLTQGTLVSHECHLLLLMMEYSRVLEKDETVMKREENMIDVMIEVLVFALIPVRQPLEQLGKHQAVMEAVTMRTQFVPTSYM